MVNVSEKVGTAAVQVVREDEAPAPAVSAGEGPEEEKSLLERAKEAIGLSPAPASCSLLRSIQCPVTVQINNHCLCASPVLASFGVPHHMRAVEGGDQQQNSAIKAF